MFIKRDDLIDDEVSGNKWRKLKYNFEHVLTHRMDGVLTFGGAFSNHLLATASACQRIGIKSIGIVRGEELTIDCNDILRQCSTLGMQIEFVSRSEYRMRNEKDFLHRLHLQYPGFYIVPEGGANYLGVVGCQHILHECERSFDQVFVAQGTTTTSCGMLLGLSPNTTLNVVPVLRSFDSLFEMQKLFIKCAFDEDYINGLLEKVRVHTNADFGGYGRYDLKLLDFMERFYAETKVPLDPVYTGKVLYALACYCEQTSDISEDILFVHTGGIKGGAEIATREKRKFFG